MDILIGIVNAKFVRKNMMFLPIIEEMGVMKKAVKILLHILKKIFVFALFVASNLSQKYWGRIVVFVLFVVLLMIKKKENFRMLPQFVEPLKKD